jgi:hypothetical protein
MAHRSRKTEGASCPEKELVRYAVIENANKKMRIGEYWKRAKDPPEPTQIRTIA